MVHFADPLGWYIPFLDLTQFPGVKELDNSQPDSTSQPIHIPKQGLLFGDRLVTTAYVSIAIALGAIYL